MTAQSTAAFANASSAKQKKIDTVHDLTDKLSRAKSVVLADYRGLKHKQLEELRKALKKVEAEFTITKNRLLLRALTSDTKTALHIRGVKLILTNTTAALFAYADEVAPLKVLLKFFQTAGFGKTKGAVLGAHILSDIEVTRLASLPTRNVLLGQLTGQLNAPIQKLHYALAWNINRFVWVLNGVRISKSSNPGLSSA